MLQEVKDSKREFPGKLSDSIAKNVFKIIYQKVDEDVSIESKIDLLYLTIMNQRYSTDYLRAQVFDNCKVDKFVTENNMFILPLVFCFPCNKNGIDIKLDKTNFSKVKKLNGHYFSYYSKLLKKFYSRNLDKSATNSITWDIRNHPEATKFYQIIRERHLK